MTFERKLTSLQVVIPSALSEIGTNFGYCIDDTVRLAMTCRFLTQKRPFKTLNQNKSSLDNPQQQIILLLKQETIRETQLEMQKPNGQEQKMAGKFLVRLPKMANYR